MIAFSFNIGLLDKITISHKNMRIRSLVTITGVDKGAHVSGEYGLRSLGDIQPAGAVVVTYGVVAHILVVA